MAHLQYDPGAPGVDEDVNEQRPGPGPLAAPPAATGSQRNVSLLVALCTNEGRVAWSREKEEKKHVLGFFSPRLLLG